MGDDDERTAGTTAAVGLGPTATQPQAAASVAFTDGFTVGCLVAGVVALLGAARWRR